MHLPSSVVDPRIPAINTNVIYLYWCVIVAAQFPFHAIKAEGGITNNVQPMMMQPVVSVLHTYSTSLACCSW